MDLQEIVRAREKELRDLRTEVGVAFDAHGTVVLEKHAQPGEPFELEFTDDEIERLRAIGDVTFTHNHPRGWQYEPDDPRRADSSFAPEDLLLACRAEMAEVRAVTPVYTFSMRPPHGGCWTEATWRTEISPLYEVVYSEKKSQLFAAALRGELGPNTASARLDHEVWTEVAQILGLRYNRVEE